jgi:hypothetical protein
MSVFGKRQSTIGPSHTGAPKSGFYAKPGKPGLDEHHGHTPARIQEAQQHDHATLGKPGKPKIFSTPIHSGMKKVAKTGAVALGGDHASAIDSLTGGVVVPGAVKSKPGWGNSDAQTGHPLARPPAAKNLKPVALSPTMRRQTGNIARSLTDSTPHSILGRAIIDEAKR